jgi:hypothetical protein
MKSPGVVSLAIGISLVASTRCNAGDVAGCYELTLSQWRPAISLGDDAMFISPPGRIELTTTPDHTWDEHGLKLTPARGVSPSIHKSSYWTDNGRRVHIVWTTGFSGLTMDLQERGSNLEGTAHTFWDFPRPRQTSRVVAMKIACEPKT